MFDSSLSWFFYQEGQTDCSQYDIGLETDQPIGDNGNEILSFEQILFMWLLIVSFFNPEGSNSGGQSTDGNCM